MQPVLIAKLLALLVIANGVPVLAKRLMGGFFAYPLDAGTRLADGRPLLGPSKTVRGVVLSIVVTAICAPLIGLPWIIGLLTGLGAMAGDAFSSFLKRRMNLAPSTMALALDQVPEALVPVLACQVPLGLTFADSVAVVVSFLFTELVLSQLLFRLKIRDRPF